MSVIKIAPSVLAADFARLGEQIGEATAAGADWIHLDVMDGHFVPNLTLGPAIAEAARRSTDLPLDVHLMIEHPERLAEAFVRAGVNSLTVHVEATVHLHRVVQQIYELGVRAAVALNPATPVEAVREVLPWVDMVLVMTVNPGYGGQQFIPTSTRKVAAVRRLLDAEGFGDVLIQVDGGIDPETAPAIVGAGANVLVAGSAVFNAQASVVENIRALRDAVGSENLPR